MDGPGESAYFLAVRKGPPLPYEYSADMHEVNRNKKSLGLSFAHPSGVSILHKLVKDCDVLVENYIPGALKKYNMDYDSLRTINPGLIYASITGYGQTGPYRHRAGYDVMVEAEMGLMHITGSRDGPPVKVGVAVTDLTTGLYTSNSIMAALLARAKTGKGQHIDVALSDCQVATLANMASSALISGEPDSGRWGTAHRTSKLAEHPLPQMKLIQQSIHRSLQSIPDLGRGHPPRRRQRPPLRSSVRQPAPTQLEDRRAIPNELPARGEPRGSRSDDRGRDEDEDNEAVARCIRRVRSALCGCERYPSDNES